MQIFPSSKWIIGYILKLPILMTSSPVDRILIQFQVTRFGTCKWNYRPTTYRRLRLCIHLPPELLSLLNILSTGGRRQYSLDKLKQLIESFCAKWFMYSFLTLSKNLCPLLELFLLSTQTAATDMGSVGMFMLEGEDYVNKHIFLSTLGSYSPCNPGVLSPFAFSQGKRVDLGCICGRM